MTAIMVPAVVISQGLPLGLQRSYEGAVQSYKKKKDVHKEVLETAVVPTSLWSHDHNWQPSLRLPASKINGEVGRKSQVAAT